MMNEVMKMKTIPDFIKITASKACWTDNITKKHTLLYEFNVIQYSIYNKM